MSKVSIIVPVYNTGKYLKKCLDSLLRQSLKDIEIIVINDGSPDNSEEIVNSYKDKRIKYFRHENRGIGFTRNRGIENATGEYLMFIDSDDYIHETCALKMYERALKDNLDIVVSDYFEDREGDISEIKFKYFENASLKENPSIINNINLGPCNKIYKRSLFDDKKNRFEEKLKYEDAPFVLKMLVSAKRIGKIDECLSYYVIHEHSETTIRDDRIFDILEISKIIIDELSNYEYMKDSLVNVLVMILADYTIQQRYITDKGKRNLFIDKAFLILDNLESSWRKCSYLKKFSFFARMIKCNKSLTKIYCTIYNWLYKKGVKK